MTSVAGIDVVIPAVIDGGTGNGDMFERFLIKINMNILLGI